MVPPVAFDPPSANLQSASSGGRRAVSLMIALLASLGYAATSVMPVQVSNLGQRNWQNSTVVPLGSEGSAAPCSPCKLWA